jgi:antitoxin component YwqK of YwqJK toxin-antitoxin module
VTNRKHHFTFFFVLQIVSVQLAIAENPIISPNEIVEKNFLIYQVGSNEPFTGRVMSTRYDGSKAYEEPYVDGRLHGARTEWDRLGNRISETTYSDGAKTGPESHWYLSGQVMAVTHYEKGARHGLSTRWCENGQKRFEWSYVNNIRNGRQSTWYVNGQKNSESIYKEGRPRGRLTKWYEDGQMKTSVDVDPDRQVLTSTNWYENGQKQCEEIRAKGEPPTKTAWDESGNRLDIDEQAYRAHCRSSLDSTTLRPGESIVSVRSGPDGATRYGTVGSETTMTDIELSASDREKMTSRLGELRECGLPGEMSR